MDPKMTISEAAAYLKITPQAIHKRIKSKELPISIKQNRFYFGYETARYLFDIPFSKKSRAIQHVKGGVGKTQTTRDVGICSTLYGSKTILIDLDPQGDLTRTGFKFNAQGKPIILDIIRKKASLSDSIVNILPGLDLIPSHIDNIVLDNTLLLERYPLDKVFKDIIKELKTMGYHNILIDCPPALSTSITAVELAVDGVIAPLNPDPASFAGLETLEEEIKKMEERYNKKIPVNIFLNEFDSRNDLSHFYKNELKDKYSHRAFKTYVRKSQAFPNSVEIGESIFDTLKITPAKEDIHLLTREILGIETPNNQQIEEELE